MESPIFIATVALIFGALAWRFNERSIRRVARQDHIRMLIEVDKSLIDHPELWRIYDDEYTNILPPKDANPWEHPRRKGLIYLLNMFEAEFDFHRHLKLRNLNWRTASDKEYHDAWRRFIKDFFARSAEAQEVWNTSRSFYSKAFADFIDGLLSSTKAESRANQASATTL